MFLAGSLAKRTRHRPPRSGVLRPNCRKHRQDLTRRMILALLGSTCGIKDQRLLATAIRLPQLSYAYCVEWRIAAAVCPGGIGAGGAAQKLVKKRVRMAARQASRGLYDPRNEHDACGVGFVVNIKGRKSHDIIAQGLKILQNLDHRGAVGADPLVGDGAGILIQMPDALLNDWARATGKSLPAVGRYAVAMCFLPRDEVARDHVIQHFEQVVAKEGQSMV